MSVSSESSRKQYNADGVDDTFIYDFYILANTEIAVYLRNDADNTSVLQTLGSDYSVTGTGVTSGGTVIFGTPPASTLKVVLTRDPAFLQESV